MATPRAARLTRFADGFHYGANLNNTGVRDDGWTIVQGAPGQPNFLRHFARVV